MLLLMIIGIITIPSDKNDKIQFENTESYISSYYVDHLKKFADLQIIPYNTDNCEYFFNKINGLYFPGGRSHRNKKFLDTCKKLFMLAKQENDKGNYFPIYGSCLGFQYLIKIISDKPLLQKHEHDKTHFLSSVKFNNNYGLSIENYKYIQNFYQVLDTYKDKYNHIFVSSIKARQYPFFGFIYTNYNDDLFLFFINECKKNKRKNKKVKEIKSVILNNYNNGFSKYAYGYN